MYDYVIRNGLVYDGKGGDPYEADIAISGNKISDIGQIKDVGKEEINAKDKIVTPGFVDIHTHFDGQVTWDPFLSPSHYHGVTTAVMGNCGVGFAPCKPERHDWLIGLMEGVEDIPGVALNEGVSWDWESFPEYLDSIGKNNYAMDIGAMIGHGPIRSYVMGMDRCQGKEEASDSEIDEMAQITKEAIEAGALGFSTSRTYLHRDKFGEYVPGTEATAKEMRKIANTIADLGQGTLEIVSDWMDQDIELDWVKEFVEKSDRTLTYAQTGGNPVETWKYCEENFSKGVKIRPQFPGRPTGMLFSLESTVHPFIAHPSYAEIADKTLEEKVATMKDESFRQKILSEEPAVDKNHMIYTLMMSFDKQFPMNEIPDYEPSYEESIAGIAESSNKSVMEVMYDEMLKNDGKTFVWAPFSPYPDHNLDTYKMMMEFESSVAGLSDGGAHCGLICDASMPTWNIAHYTRDRVKGEKIPLEFLVRKQTKETAETFGLMDRGQIKEGYMADINIIDHENLCVYKPEMVHDLPTGSRRIIQKAGGYIATIKSGVVTFKDDKATGELPGTVLRGERTAEAISA